MNFRLIKTANKINVKYKGAHIGDTNITKFLSIQIDDKICWKAQLEIELNTYTYTLYILSKVIVDRNSVLPYHGYVASILRYAIIFWGNAINVNPVFKVLRKRCVKAICRLKRIDIIDR